MLTSDLGFEISEQCCLKTTYFVAAAGGEGACRSQNKEETEEKSAIHREKLKLPTGNTATGFLQLLASENSKEQKDLALLWGSWPPGGTRGSMATKKSSLSLRASAWRACALFRMDLRVYRGLPRFRGRKHLPRLTLPFPPLVLAGLAL